MTHDEYEAHPLAEAVVEFHSDPGRGVVYVTVMWAHEGFKFVVAEKLMPPTGAECRAVLAHAEDMLDRNRELVAECATLRKSSPMSADLSLVEGYLRGANVEKKISQAFVRIRNRLLGRVP